ncbi:hypothetical protein [Enterobacter sp. WCHEn045836]|uniref:hypothetical protein n=1 Tax=Enterobacter sp. WCHEn045836 TaxID=2497434 RepID=UPI001639A065|nr:hypothetical protein [Enterobacter sp. WCHEn045836]
MSDIDKQASKLSAADFITAIAEATELRPRDGRDGVARCVYEQIFKPLQDELATNEARCAALAAENTGLKAAINATIGWQQSTDPENVESVRMLVDVKTPVTDALLAEVRVQGVESLSDAVQSVISERQRQQSVEGWASEHDDQYSKSQLLWASSCYLLNTIQPFNRIPLDWPWAPEWWKPTNPRRDLVKAGALILAEIERIDRQEAAQ